MANYKAELKKLERLMRSDDSSFMAEMNKPWDRMEDDLQIASVIMHKHLAQSGEALRLVEDFAIDDDPNGNAHIKLGGWITEISSDFYMRYADENERRFRFQKTMHNLVAMEMEALLLN